MKEVEENHIFQVLRNDKGFLDSIFRKIEMIDLHEDLNPEGLINSSIIKILYRMNCHDVADDILGLYEDKRTDFYEGNQCRVFISMNMEKDGTWRA